MDAVILTTLLKDIVIPEVLVAIRAHHNATGNLPTDAEVIAALDVDALKVKAQGQDFLDATRPLPAAPPATPTGT